MFCRSLLSVIVVLFSLNVLALDKILILGDSLTEGYGVDEEYSFPSVLEGILKENKHNYKVINGGISGSTTASGKSRLRWFFKAEPKILIIALGANDGLRGIKVSESVKNLEEIIGMAKSKGIKVVLAGMMLPPNYGEKYTLEFKSMFKDLTKKHELHSIPFLLKGVAGKKKLNIEDGIHPNREGYKVIARNVYLQIKGIL